MNFCVSLFLLLQVDLSLSQSTLDRINQEFKILFVQITNATNSECISLASFSGINDTVALLQKFVEPIELPAAILAREIKWNDEGSKMLRLAILDEESETEIEHFINDEVCVALEAVVSRLDTAFLFKFFEGLAEGDNYVSWRSEGELARFFKSLALHAEIESEGAGLVLARVEEVFAREADGGAGNTLNAFIEGGDKNIADLVGLHWEAAETGHGVDDDGGVGMMSLHDGIDFLDGVDDTSASFRVHSDEGGEVLCVLDGFFELFEIHGSTFSECESRGFEPEAAADVCVASAVSTVADDESSGVLAGSAGGDGRFNTHCAAALHRNACPLGFFLDGGDVGNVDDALANLGNSLHEEGVTGTVVDLHGFLDSGSGEKRPRSKQQLLFVEKKRRFGTEHLMIDVYLLRF